MKGLLTFGLLNTNQVKTLYFSKIDKRTVLRRLRKLAKAKWIIRHKTTRGGEVIWTLNSKGATHLNSDFALKRINKASLGHDLLVNDMKIKLDELKVASNWKSSHLLRHKANLNKNPYTRTPDSIPDWLFTMKLKSASPVMAMEVELNFKGKRRMEKVFKMYRQKDSIKHVWYIVPNKKFGEKVFESSQRISHNRGRFWAIYSIINDLKDNPKKAKVYFENGSTCLENLCGLDAHGPAHSVSNKEENKMAA